MKDKNILLIGYGSIGKRHTKNLIDIGIKPYILTKYPDDLDAIFLRDIEEIKDLDINFCIIATPTSRHLDDLKRCLTLSNIPRKILIEKPLECFYLKGEKIKDISKKYGIDIFVAYNMRFLKIFNIIKKFIEEKKDTIRIVDIVAGQDLKRWRPYKDYTESYSAHRDQGGGVDLDLSHEIDYVLWLFGDNFKDKIIFRNKISNLKINSPDIFKLILEYNTFIVDITLDYIRSPKERYIKIICENGKNLYYDFITSILKISDKKMVINDNIEQSYKEMLKALLSPNKINENKLSSVEDGLDVLKILEI
ncbi:MAG: Gfo/Idh/MocA family oxidoreductase [Promethearchaeota archaeon]|nr:MAG: Gfo/Idh/MocA family oxidoreductase [Candidatus Lokiarchaeota archaeon]